MEEQKTKFKAGCMTKCNKSLKFIVTKIS